MMARVGNSEVMRAPLLESTDDRRARSETSELHSIDIVSGEHPHGVASSLGNFTFCLAPLQVGEL